MARFGTRSKSRTGGVNWLVRRDARGEQHLHCRYCDCEVTPSGWWFHVCPEHDQALGLTSGEGHERVGSAAKEPTKES